MMVNYLKTHIRRIRYITSFVSIALTVLALGAFLVKGLNLGLDFTGGWLPKSA
ncbi:preprotein translocase subunit SecF [Vibrio cincinnatiensis]|nr:preprotein translocase subunit SecF [Vibrio cincinnatiensis]